MAANDDFSFGSPTAARLMSGQSPFFSREQTFVGYHEIFRKVPKGDMRVLRHIILHGLV